MKNKFIPVFLLSWLALTNFITAQDKAISPSLIITGTFHGETPPLRDIPPISDAELQIMAEKARQKVLNPELAERSYPFAETALPKGPDAVWQKEPGAGRELRAPIMNFEGQQTSAYYPPDPNGTVGPGHYMQTINTTYAIYNKTGVLVAGPTAMNTLFSGVTGSNYNDGDPIVLYDEQADRWLAAEFSITGNNDYMLIAVSTTNDPTGTWYKYSFDVADMPDYMKFGIWQDGYYMGTNNSTGMDIYVFERSKMLSGLTAQAVGFNNAWRPTTIDGFMCVPPLDNDGPFAPTGEPGLFITINDDAIGSGSDQLWIYELHVDWTTPANSTFTRIQQINVAAFDSNFGNNWDNIKQLGTTRELDAIPQVVMNPPQYRNFGSFETIVCCHTVDVDATDHAGVRWYELRRVSSGNWTIRQQGTYAPDAHSRWMGSIMLNGHNEIGLGYSVSSSTIYPGIRYCGQSAAVYASATGLLDVAEETIQDGVFYQSAYNRWGDYSGLQIDPTDDQTFWFTNEYIGSSGARRTKIASFTISTLPAQWTGNSSGNWSTPSNWSSGTVPTSATNVIIPPSSTNWPEFTEDFTLGINCANLTLSNGAQMSVTGNFTINADYSLTFSGDGELSISGDWTNNGTLTPGAGTINFFGTTSSTVNAPVTSAANYTRTAFTKGMTALTGVTDILSGNDNSLVISLGFTFNYAGVNYTNARFCTNGWLSLDQSGTTSNINEDLFTITAPNTTLAPWWDDLEDDDASYLYYKTEGSAPNRVFTAEWNRIKTFSTNNVTARISFQVKLFESTNVIEFHYGLIEGTKHNNDEGASIGIEDVTGGMNHFIEAVSGSTSAGNSALKSPANWPTINYRFTPPATTQIFQNIIVTKSGSYVDFNTNTVVNNTFDVMPGASFKVINGKTITVGD